MTSSHLTRLRPFALALAVVSVCLAQNAAALEHDGQGWILTTASGPISGNWKAYVEAQPRLSDDGQTLLLRPAVGYQITPQWSLWQGYAWTPSFNPDKDEHRIFQQSVFETPKGFFPFALTNRTRLEERWIEHTDQTAFRLRHMLRGMQPIGDTGKWALVAYDEVFLNLNDVDNGPQEGFAQNRAFFGINRELTPRIHGEVGYLNQFLRSDGKEDSMNHNGLLALYYKW
ncbi:MAG: hypothetical protein ACI89X_003920 [Planctomycetota bacterium]|jgi:hypothetical protein